MPRKMPAAVSLFTADLTTASSGLRVSGFSQTVKNRRVNRSPNSSAPNCESWGRRWVAGAVAAATAAAKTCSFFPK